MRVTDKHVFFWKGNDIYSNFYYSPFKHQGKMFKWSEQAIMYRKAKLFGANHIADKVLKAGSPVECKRLGRRRDLGFVESVWDEEKCRIFKEVLRDKFSLPQLKQQILQTGDKILVEASPYDNIWGIGMGENDKGVDDPENWKGQNLLGKVLGDIREELKR